MAQRKNPFVGNGLFVVFTNALYERYMSREWFTNTDVMEIVKPKIDLYHNDDVLYGELKKASRNMIKLLEESAGTNCIETKAGKRNSKIMRYVGDDNDPLHELRHHKAIRDIKLYADFCASSAGFFPFSWFEHFFKDSIDLLNVKQKKAGQMIVSSLDRELKNIEMLPMLYEAIRDKKVLCLSYQPFGEEMFDVIFHPHLLKEYNGRWFLFGHAEGREPEFGYNIPLDRIVGEPTVVDNNEKIYISASPKDFYKDFFRNIVGVSHYSSTPVVDVVVRAHNRKIFALVSTKKIHHSQTTIKEFDDKGYGEFNFHVEVNNEFIGRILQLGDGLEIVSPADVRELFRERIASMAALYK